MRWDRGSSRADPCSLRLRSPAERRHLLTEDVVQFATVTVLAEQGLPADRLAAERTIAGIGRVELLVDPPGGAAIEFKFSREPSVMNTADTMAFDKQSKDDRAARETIRAIRDRETLWTLKFADTPMSARTKRSRVCMNEAIHLSE